MDEQKITLSFVAIVAVVAIVGIVLLFMNYGQVTGEATKGTPKPQPTPHPGDVIEPVAGGTTRNCCDCDEINQTYGREGASEAKYKKACSDGGCKWKC